MLLRGGLRFFRFFSLILGSQYFCTPMAEVKSSSSSAVGFWTSKEVAPATIEAIKVASYLIISAALDDFDPKISNMVPPKLIHFIDEVMDGTVNEA